nr:hypothetical protein GCM10020092_088550 [Actinoplanes digitatis]
MSASTPLDEAARYLADKLHHDPRKLQEAAELAADLGHLPLALAQAAAYLLDRGLTCATYRTRLANHRKKLAELFPEAHALPDDHQATVDVTWSLSITAADHLTPTGLARPVLELAAMLDPNGIPTTLFRHRRRPRLPRPPPHPNPHSGREVATTRLRPTMLATRYATCTGSA